MRKSKLTLHRETLRHLSSRGLRGAQGASAQECGGSGNTTCQSDISNCLSNLVPGFCDPSLNTECVSRCLACPDTGGPGSVYC